MLKNVIRFLPALFITSLLFFACEKKSSINNNEENSYFENDKVIKKEDGSLWLYGGISEDQHFDISNMDLNLNNLLYGLGRESFLALDSPAYEKLSEMSVQLDDEEEVILIHSSKGPLVYPLDLMSSHEVINDVIDGEPVIVSYCVLADFIGIFSRNYCKQTLTFGVSGYTYFDVEIKDVKDSFILWDRNTESLWWPIINRGVSGILKNAQLSKDLPFTWERSTIAYLRANFPDAMVLSYGQTKVPPMDFPRLLEADFDCD